MPDIATQLRLFAAGSLRHVLPALVAQHGTPAELVFGPAGLLRERIEGGDVPDLFLSADLGHPRAVAALRPGGMVQPFARNAIVVVARRTLGLTTANLLDRLLEGDVRIGTSTPGADPGGDYAHRLFDRTEALRPGARARLLARARALVGGRDSPAASPYSYLERGEVDVFIGYASAAVGVADGFEAVVPPQALAVMATYGLVALSAGADSLAASIASPAATPTLIQHGFLPVERGASPGRA